MNGTTCVDDNECRDTISKSLILSGQCNRHVWISQHSPRELNKKASMMGLICVTWRHPNTLNWCERENMC